jgi:PAS domain S-box-containing protein
MIFATPMFSEEKMSGIRGIVIDMTEYMAMEKALRESEEKYRALINNATDGIVITQKGLIKFCNPAMCEMMQYSQEELLEKPYLDYVLKEDHAVMTNFHKRRMEGENFTSIYRSQFIPKDGKIIVMELNARTSEYNGEPAAFIVIRNITERIKIEKELQHAKDELEKLNKNLEKRIEQSSFKLTEAHTQLIRLQKENLQSQFEVLRQQVNPHFLFNSLNVLTSLIKLEPDLAEQFTEHLSKVYRYVLENKDNDLVNLHTELDFLDAYVFLLHIRFMDKIIVKVDIVDEKKELLILPLALQLLIENAIKHNSMSKKNPLIIEITIDNENVLNVVNNLQERESHMVSTGVGLKNIEHRYHLLEMPAPQFIKTETKFIARIPLRS